MKGIPNNLGSTADKLLELRTKRLELEKKVQALKAQETQLSDALLKELTDQGLTGARGKQATISINPTVVGTVVNWEEVEKYVQKTGYFHLFQRRISNLAYLELLQSSDTGVPGIEPTTLTKLSLTRASK